jgi:hypothetical protein
MEVLGIAGELYQMPYRIEQLGVRYPPKQYSHRSLKSVTLHNDKRVDSFENLIYSRVVCTEVIEYDKPSMHQKKKGNSE